MYPLRMRHPLLLALALPAVILPPTCLSRVNAQTRIVSVMPGENAVDVELDVVVQIHFSNGLALRTISAETIQLLDAAGTSVPTRLGFDLEGDVVNLRAQGRLRANTRYTLTVKEGLLDKDGAPAAPFRSTFMTGNQSRDSTQVDGFQFKQTKIDDEHGPTAIAVGPDGNVYVATYGGLLYRLRIDSQSGRVVGKDRLLSLPEKKILGLTFDPESTATMLVAWITYDDRKAETLDVGTFSGVVSKVRLPTAGSDEDCVESQYIIGLPSGWHPLNGGTFGPDGRLYISVGSMNRLGHDPLRPETLLSAAVVVADVRALVHQPDNLPLNVQTTAPVHYDPSDENAPVRLFATGFRQMYRVCWHSNGNLYGGVNQNDGTGRSDTPSASGVPSLFAVFPDEPLVRIVEGGYYGHPNPSRNQFVLMGGNPTADLDPWEIPEYPVGVAADPNFHPQNLIFNLKTVNGTSANGCVEYTPPGVLQGRLLICFYEGTQTIHTFEFNDSGTAVVDDGPLLDANQEPLRFAHPLDVAVHADGRIYVADFGDWRSFGGGGAIWVLDESKPKEK